MNSNTMKALIIICSIIVLVSCQSNNRQSGLLPEVKEVELSKIDPELFNLSLESDLEVYNLDEKSLADK